MLSPCAVALHYDGNHQLPTTVTHLFIKPWRKGQRLSRDDVHLTPQARKEASKLHTCCCWLFLGGNGSKSAHTVRV